MTGAIPRWACALDRAWCRVETVAAAVAGGVYGVVLVCMACVCPALLVWLLWFATAALVPAVPAPWPLAAAPEAMGGPGWVVIAVLIAGTVVCTVVEAAFVLEEVYGDDWRERCQRARLRGS